MWDVLPKEIANKGWERIQLILKTDTLQSFEYELDFTTRKKSFELRMVKERR